MIRLSVQTPKVLAAFLCIALGLPGTMLARSRPQNIAADPARAAAPERAERMASTPQLLDQDELAKLSARNQEPGPEVRGGALTNEHLTYIVIALAAAVLVLVLK